MLFTIAFRNILRNKRRAFLTALVIAVGMTFYIYVDSILTGMNNSSIRNMVEFTDGSIKIQTKKYDEESRAFPLKYGVENAGQIKKVLLSEEAITGATTRSRFTAMVGNYIDSLPVVGYAIDEKEDGSVFNLGEYIIDGEYFSENGENELLIGKSLAKDFGVKAGDYLSVSANDAYDTQNLNDFKIVGVFNAPVGDLNTGAVYMKYSDANYFLDFDNLVTSVYAHINWKQGLPYAKYMEEVNSAISDIEFDESLSVTTIEDAAKDFLSITATKDKMTGVIYLIVIMIAMVGIVNAVLMSVYERIREVGVMRAMGFTGGEIIRMFMYEGVMIGVIGGIGAIVFGGVLNLVLVNVGINISAFGGDTDAITAGLPMGEVMYGQWNISSFVFVFCFAVIVAFFASIIPSRKAASMVVTKALRFE